MRYLVRSEQDIPGCLGFAASAHALADRDQWIGWDPLTRKQQLLRVLSLSRFLIRSDLQSRNLASKALSLCLHRLLEDFRRKYHFEPLLPETFVDPTNHEGTCFKTANWIAIGRTAGRGRFAPSDAPAGPRKTIFVSPLCPDWRTKLGVPDPRLAAPLGPGDGLNREHWAACEFGAAPLGDSRLSRRLVTCATILAEDPLASLPSAAQGDRTLVKGWYRFLDHPLESALTPENLPAAHRERTLGRMLKHGVVLCVQDGTDLHCAEHGAS